MGRLIDEDKLVDHFIDKTPNGWLVSICENTSSWSLEGIISEIKHFKPTVEAIPKSDYEVRLKADLKVALVELQLEIEKLEEEADIGKVVMIGAVDRLIQQKINALKAESEDK